ncbi:uncharacterized protein LOC131621396 [Vicia villosa]|uniref:uncharacterized protein LOC131621396 n=1 Tax=Vicia villosa TaxID=3911 RepID=UPI00273BD8FA|nr:uncharacterized protein LOC131621396 [Vicia villosa]
MVISYLMPAEEESIGYSFHVSTTHHNYSSYLSQNHRLDPAVSDFFRFQVTAYVREFLSPNLMRGSEILRTSIRINCNEFFMHDQDFLWLYLSEFSSPYFNSENLSQMTRVLIPKVKQLFLPNPIDDIAAAVPNHVQEFPVDLTIKVEDMRTIQERERAVMEHFERIIQERERAVMEESMQFGPASDEAILSLKAYSLPRNCCICMERFHDELEEGGDSDDVKISTMVCGHVFHYDCIVKWLQTSRACPLCRYAMPT